MNWFKILFQTLRRRDSLWVRPLTSFVPPPLLWNAPGNVIATITFIGLWVTYRLASNYILNQMYADGSYGDTNLFSTVLWRNGWDLHIPGIYISDSFFKLHMCLILWLPNFISHYLPVDRIPYLAGCQGVFYAILAFSFILCLQLLWPSNRIGIVIVRTVMGVLFAFNPITEDMLTQALLEVTAIALVILFLVALVKERYRWASLAFIMALSVREDVGCHIFGLISVVIAMDVLRKVPFVRWKYWLLYAAIAITYSIAVIGVQYRFIGAFGNLNAVYLDNPPFSHVTWPRVALHLHAIFNDRSCIWLSALMALLWSVTNRNIYIIAGFISCIPWFILSVMAPSQTAAELAIHYAYPFDIAIVWAFIAATPRFVAWRGITPPRIDPSLVSALFPVMPLLLFFAQQAIIMPNNIHFTNIFNSSQLKPNVAHAAIYDLLEVKLTADKGELHHLRVDQPVKAIAAYALNSTEDELEIRPNDDGTFPAPPTGIDSLMYMKNSYTVHPHQFQALLRVNHLRHSYWLPGTDIWLLTNFEIPETSGFYKFFYPKEPEFGGQCDRRPFQPKHVKP